LQINKLTIDFPLIAKQCYAWTVTQAEKMTMSSDKQDKKQLQFFVSLMEQIQLIRQGILRGLRPGGQIDRIVRATAQAKQQLNDSVAILLPVAQRIAENIKRADYHRANADLQREGEEILAYIQTNRATHGENLRVFFDAAVTKVQEQMAFVGKNPPPAALPGTEIVRAYDWGWVWALDAAINRVKHVKRQVSLCLRDIDSLYATDAVTITAFYLFGY